MTPTKPSPETGEADVKAAQEPGERAKALEWLTSGEHGSIHDFDCMTEHGHDLAECDSWVHDLAECDCWVSAEAERLVSLLASARAEGGAAGLEDACDLVAAMEEIIHAAVGRIWFERFIRLRAPNQEER